MSFNQIKEIFHFDILTNLVLSKSITELSIDSDDKNKNIKLNLLLFIADLDDKNFEIKDNKDLWYEKKFSNKNLEDYKIIVKCVELMIKLIIEELKGNEKRKLIILLLNNERYQNVFFELHKFINSFRTENQFFLEDNEAFFLFSLYIGGKFEKFIKKQFIDRIIKYLDNIDTDYTNLNFQVLNENLIFEINKCAISLNSSFFNYKDYFEKEKKRLISYSNENIFTEKEKSIKYINEDNKNKIVINYINDNNLNEQYNIFENKNDDNFPKTNEIKENNINDNNIINNNNISPNQENNNKGLSKNKESKKDETFDDIISDCKNIIKELYKYKKIDVNDIEINNINMDNLKQEFLRINFNLNINIGRILNKLELQTKIFKLNENISKLENEVNILKISISRIETIKERLKSPNLIIIKRKILDIIFLNLSIEFKDSIDLNNFNPDEKFLIKIKKKILEKQINNNNQKIQKALELIENSIKEGYKEGFLYFHNNDFIKGKFLKNLIDILYFMKNQLNPYIQIGKGKEKFFLLPKVFYDDNKQLNNYAKLFLEIYENEKTIQNNSKTLNQQNLFILKNISHDELLDIFFHNNFSLETFDSNFINKIRDKFKQPSSYSFFEFDFELIRLNSNILDKFPPFIRNKIIERKENYEKLFQALVKNLLQLILKNKPQINISINSLFKELNNYLIEEFSFDIEGEIKKSFINDIFESFKLNIIHKELKFIISSLEKIEDKKKKENNELALIYIEKLNNLKDLIIESNKCVFSPYHLFQKWKKNNEKNITYKKFEEYLRAILPDNIFIFEEDFNFSFKELVWLSQKGIIDIIV